MEPVQLRDEACIPFIWTQRFRSVDYSCLQSLREAMSPSYFTRLVRSYEVEHLLCEPEPAFAFDLETIRRRAAHARALHAAGGGGRPGGWLLPLLQGGLRRGAGLHGLPAARAQPRGDDAAAGGLARVRAASTRGLELELPELSDPRSWRWRFS